MRLGISLRLCFVSASLLGGCAGEAAKPVVAAKHRPTYKPPGEAQQASYPPGAAPASARSVVQPTGQAAADCVPSPGINAAQEDDLFRRFDQTRAQGGDDATVVR